MSKNIILIGTVVIVFLFGILSFIIFQKTLPEKPVVTQNPAPEIKKVDLSTQPEWVQKLEVTAVRGRSNNGLQNVTFRITGIPRALVSNINYVVQYQTANKGSQGALSTKPIEVGGSTEVSKTIDLGTCSTKSCVTHDGVTAIELELDFTTSDGSQFSWSKTIPLTP